MATFISTTLTKRTGSTTTVFSPFLINGGVGELRASGTYTWITPSVTMSAKNTGVARRTVVRTAIPQLEADGYTVRSRAWAQLELYIPEATVQTDVNDLVGYVNALTASGLTNLNDLLVNGHGVY